MAIPNPACAVLFNLAQSHHITNTHTHTLTIIWRKQFAANTSKKSKTKRKTRLSFPPPHH